jgi:uncharacterized membrane protein
MFIPRFTLRWTLGLTAVMAVVFLVSRWAMQGNAWAVGATGALLTLVLSGFVYASVFAVIWLFSLLFAVCSSRVSRARQKGADG